MPRRRKNGRHTPRTPVNVVYRTIQASGGPTATARALGVSLATLARWRREGRVTDAAAVLRWAELVYPPETPQAYRLARQLAGLAGNRRGR